MYGIIKCNVQGKEARVKNADLRHPSCTYCNVKTQICVTRPQCVKKICTPSWFYLQRPENLFILLLFSSFVFYFPLLFTAVL